MMQRSALFLSLVFCTSAFSAQAQNTDTGFDAITSALHNLQEYTKSQREHSFDQQAIGRWARYSRKVTKLYRSVYPKINKKVRALVFEVGELEMAIKDRRDLVWKIDLIREVEDRRIFSDDLIESMHRQNIADLQEIRLQFHQELREWGWPREKGPLAIGKLKQKWIKEKVDKRVSRKKELRAIKFEIKKELASIRDTTWNTSTVEGTNSVHDLRKRLRWVLRYLTMSQPVFSAKPRSCPNAPFPANYEIADHPEYTLTENPGANCQISYCALKTLAWLEERLSHAKDSGEFVINITNLAMRSDPDIGVSRQEVREEAELIRKAHSFKSMTEEADDVIRIVREYRPSKKIMKCLKNICGI